MQGRLIDAKSMATLEQAARVDASINLAELWAWVVKAKSKADILEVELTYTLEGQ